MCVEFCHDVTEGQLEHVATAILPHLPKVIVQTDVYSVQTRTRAVHIYNLLAGIIFSISMVFQVGHTLWAWPTETSLLRKLILHSIYVEGSWSSVVWMCVYVGGSWSSVVCMCVYVGGSWSSVVCMCVYVGGSWSSVVCTCVCM